MIRIIFLAAVLMISSTFAQYNRTARILGGRGAEQGEVPYHVSLRTFGSTFHFCGGALISNRWIVTAGTCVNGRARNSLNIVAGSVSLSTGVGRRSSNIVLHPQFDHSSIEHNIALVQTGIAFPLSQNIWPVRLSSTILRGEVPAVVSGFGAVNSNGGSNSQILQILFLNTHFDGDCEIDNINWAFNLCTSNGLGEGFCTSDLGGPLVSNFELIGIANWNLPCGLGVVDLYARISFYRLWIGGVSGI